MGISLRSWIARVRILLAGDRYAARSDLATGAFARRNHCGSERNDGYRAGAAPRRAADTAAQQAAAAQQAQDTAPTPGDAVRWPRRRTVDDRGHRHSRGVSGGDDVERTERVSSRQSRRKISASSPTFHRQIDRAAFPALLPSASAAVRSLSRSVAWRPTTYHHASQRPPAGELRRQPRRRVRSISLRACSRASSSTRRPTLTSRASDFPARRIFARCDRWTSRIGRSPSTFAVRSIRASSSTPTSVIGAAGRRSATSTRSRRSSASHLAWPTSTRRSDEAHERLQLRAILSGR